METKKKKNNRAACNKWQEFLLCQRHLKLTSLQMTPEREKRLSQWLFSHTFEVGVDGKGKTSERKVWGRRGGLVMCPSRVNWADCDSLFFYYFIFFENTGLHVDPHCSPFSVCFVDDDGVKWLSSVQIQSMPNHTTMHRARNGCQRNANALQLDSSTVSRIVYWKFAQEKKM